VVYIFYYQEHEEQGSQRSFNHFRSKYLFHKKT